MKYPPRKTPKAASPVRARNRGFVPDLPKGKAKERSATAKTKASKRAIGGLRKLRGRLPTDADVVGLVREVREMRTDRIAMHFDDNGKRVYITAGNILPDIPPPAITGKLGVGAERDRRVQVKAADDASEFANERRVESFEIGSEMKKAGLSNSFIVAAVATADEFEGIFNLMKMWRAESGMGERDAIIADIEDLIEDIAVTTPPEASVRNPWIADVTMKAPPGVYSAARAYSDHMLIHDLLSVVYHGLAAQKILNDPSLIERARTTLERWISKERRVPQPFIEWRQILTGMSRAE